MAEAHGRRALLEMRIKYGNYAVNGFAVGTVLSVIMALSTPKWDVWLIGGAFVLAGTVICVRMVTAARIELFQMGSPGPSLVFRDAPEDEDWN